LLFRYATEQMGHLQSGFRRVPLGEITHKPSTTVCVGNRLR
jgi:hypothetical protein